MIVQKTIKDAGQDFIASTRTLLMSIIPSTAPFVMDKVMNILSLYTFGDYRFIPIYSDTESNYHLILANKFVSNLLKNYNILIQINSECRLAELQFNKKSENDYNTISNFTKTKRGSNNYTTTHSGYDERQTIDTTRTMSENSPIDENIENILSPNYKDYNTHDSSIKDIYNSSNDKTDTFNEQMVDDGIDKTVSTQTEYSPEMFAIFMELSEKYNIPYILNNELKRIIYEFNRLI